MPAGRNEDRVAVPLSEADRARIIQEIGQLPEKVRGNDVPQLVGLIEEALAVDEADLLADPEAFGRFQPASDAALEKLRGGLQALVDAARVVEPMLPPVDASELKLWREQFPWWDELDHVAPALLGLGIANDDIIIRRTETDLQRAVTTINQLFARADSFVARPGNSKRPPAVRWLVRACAFYRSCQKLPVTSNWINADDNRGAQAGEQRLVPGTDYDILLEKVSAAFAIDVSSSTLRYQANRYRQLLGSFSNRAPLKGDFDSSLRHFITG